LSSSPGKQAQSVPRARLPACLRELEHLVAEVGVRALVTHLTDAGLLAAGRDPATAADACWALTGPRVFLDLTTDRGWQPGQYEDWLTRMLAANLLAPPATCQRGDPMAAYE
jgi:hypothetical protein